MKSSPKRDGVPRSTPIPNPLFNSAQPKTGFGFAQVCEHKFTVTRQERMATSYERLG
jgi:hypothetical protein